MYSVEWQGKLKFYKTLKGAFKAYQKKEHALIRNIETDDIIYEK